MKHRGATVGGLGFVLMSCAAVACGAADEADVDSTPSPESERFDRAPGSQSTLAADTNGSDSAEVDSASSFDDESVESATEADTASDGAADEDASSQESGDLGASQKPLLGLPISIGLDIFLPSSCEDSTGLESVLAGLGVATATELHRWQPLKDFQMVSGSLALSATGKAQCADGKCFNTQALLDLQKDAAKVAQLKPGVFVNPSLLRTTFAVGMAAQKTCFTFNPLTMIVPLIGCQVPEHRFELAGTSKGTCDTNYWFSVQKPSGSAFSPASNLKSQLLWLGVDDNSYIKFQSSGNTIAIDPTYGLNETGSTSTGSCTAACTKIASTNVAGQCCSCAGKTTTYKRSAWSGTTFLCQ